MSYRASLIDARFTVINEVLTTIPSWSSRILLPLATHCHTHYHLHPFHFIKCKDLVVKQHQDRDAYSTALHCKCLQYATALQIPIVCHCTASAYSTPLYCKCLQYGTVLQVPTVWHCTKCLQYGTTLQVPTVRHCTASTYSTPLYCKCLQYTTALQVPTVWHCTANSEFLQDRLARAQGQMLFCLGNVT